MMSRLIAGMLVALLISTNAYATEFQKRRDIDIQRTTLWQLIETLIDQPSFDAIKQTLPVEFSEYQRRATISFYKGGPLHLLDQVVIKTATLVIEHRNEVSSMIGLDLDPGGACVTLDDVRAHYPNIEIIGGPRGHSLDEKTHWAVEHSWGRLSFGFKEANRRCLASVGIGRNEPSS